jgi:hypothetical protein
VPSRVRAQRRAPSKTFSSSPRDVAKGNEQVAIAKPYSTDGFSACVCRVCASAGSCLTKPVCAVRADLRAAAEVDSSVLTPQCSDTRSGSDGRVRWCRDVVCADYTLSQGAGSKVAAELTYRHSRISFFER